MSLSEKLKLEVLFAAVDKLTKPLQSIRTGSTAAAKAMKEAKDAVKGLENQQKLIDSFRSTNKALGITTNDLGKARERVRLMAQEMEKTATPTAKMQRAFAEATTEARNLAASVNRLSEKKQELRKKLSGAGIDTKNLANYQRDLKGKIEAATSAITAQGAALEAANKKMQKMHAARATYDKTMATRDKLGGAAGKLAIAGAAVNAAGAMPVMAYAQAEDSATQLKIAMMQKGGVVSAQFKEINDLAMKLGNKLPGTTADYQDMMTTLIRQGMPAKALLGGLGEATAYLAVQLKMPATAAAEFASELQHATRTADKDMMGLMDTIQKSFNLGVSQDHMLQGFAKLSPALSILRKEGAAAAKELAPLLVMAKNSGMAGESAGNAYRKIFQQSMDKRKMEKGNAELSGTGVKLDFTNGKGEFGGLDKMYAQLEKLKGVNTQQRLAALKKMFGDDAETLQALTLMIERGADGYKEVQAKMEAQANIQERVNAQLNTLRNLWDAASGTFTNALVTFGESIAPELHASAEFLGRVAEGIQSFAKENPGFTHGVMTMVKWIGLLLIVLGALAAGAAAILGPIAAIKFGLAALGIQGLTVFSWLGTAFRAFGASVMALGRLMLMNPIGFAITAIAAAAYLIYRNWEPIKAFFGGIWDQVRQAFAGGLTGILALIINWSPLGQFYSAMAGVLSYFGIELPSKFTEFGSMIMSGWGDGITKGIAYVRDAIGAAGDAVVGFFKEKLGIHSPSRVFEEFGGFTMQGLAQGLGSNDAPLDAMKNITKKLTLAGAGIALSGSVMAANADGIDPQAMAPLKAMSSKLAKTSGIGLDGGSVALDDRQPVSRGAGASGTAAPMQLTVNVYPSPGMDEAALARLVAKELQRVEAERNARSRSRLTDNH